MRLYGVDLLRGIAAFGIVGCHLMLSPRTDAGSWATHFCDMNVAVFATLAGYFTHSGGSGVLCDIKRRLSRLLPLYFFWSVVFVLASLMFKTIAHDDMSQYGQVGFWSGVIFRGGSSCHLWFIAALIYTQTLALFLMRWRFSVALPLAFAAGGLLLSVVLSNWYGRYFFRLFGFVWLGVVLRAFSRGTWKLYGGLTCLALVLHVLFTGVLHGFICDLLVTVPLVLFAVRLSTTCLAASSWILSLAKMAGRTSLGIYLIHPLLTRLGGCLIARLCETPYGLIPILLDWTLSWGGAFLLTLACLKLPYLRRIVQ